MGKVRNVISFKGSFLFFERWRQSHIQNSHVFLLAKLFLVCTVKSHTSIFLLCACVCVRTVVSNSLPTWEAPQYSLVFLSSSVQFSSVTQSCLTLCDPMECSTQGFPVHHQLPELAQTHAHQVTDVILPSYPLSSPSPPPSIFPSIRVFSNESVLPIRWPKYWSFSFSISPSNEYSGLISFRIDWLDLLAVQETLKSLPQLHSSKASVLRCSAFFIVQLSHPYMTTGKTIALTRWTFVNQGTSLLFNMLSRLVIAFLPRSKHLLISWLQSPSAVVLERKKIKSVTVCCSRET